MLDADVARRRDDRRPRESRTPARSGLGHGRRVESDQVGDEAGLDETTIGQTEERCGLPGQAVDRLLERQRTLLRAPNSARCSSGNRQSQSMSTSARARRARRARSVDLARVPVNLVIGRRAARYGSESRGCPSSARSSIDVEGVLAALLRELRATGCPQQVFVHARSLPPRCARSSQSMSSSRKSVWPAISDWSSAMARSRHARIVVRWQHRVVDRAPEHVLMRSGTRAQCYGLASCSCSVVMKRVLVCGQQVDRLPPTCPARASAIAEPGTAEEAGQHRPHVMRTPISRREAGRTSSISRTSP